MEDLTHGGFFEGIGGFSLAAKWAGVKTIWQSEIAKYQCELLRKRFPEAKLFGDITKINDLEYVDIITGGFPCQDISLANNQAQGIEGSRSGLWSEMFRLVRKIRPKYAVIENSSALTFRGLEKVLFDLSEIGYDAEWQCIQGGNIGVQQKRERIYLVAYPHQVRQEGRKQETMVFKQLPRESLRISPGWRTRRDIPTPRTIRSANDVPAGLHRIEGLGNSIIPLIAYYIFECIKIHHSKLYH